MAAIPGRRNEEAVDFPARLAHHILKWSQDRSETGVQRQVHFGPNLRWAAEFVSHPAAGG